MKGFRIFLTEDNSMCLVLYDGKYYPCTSISTALRMALQIMHGESYLYLNESDLALEMYNPKYATEVGISEICKRIP